ncbi:hypothetical protein D3C76_1330760 [compost metagenome]
MVRYDYEKFVELEQLIYSLRDSDDGSFSDENKESDDVFEKIKKLAELKSLNLITEQEYESKKNELLSKI